MRGGGLDAAGARPDTSDKPGKGVANMESQRNAMEFRVWSPKLQGGELVLHVERRPAGWNIYYGNCPHTEDAGKDGMDHLSEEFEKDYINFPSGLPAYMEKLWEMAEHLPEEKVQQALDQLAEWVSVTAKAMPGGGVWQPFFAYCPRGCHEA